LLAKASVAAAAASLGAAAGALAYRAAWREPRSLGCPEVALALPGWPPELDGLRVALVADVHAGAGHMTPARLAATVDAVLALRADVHLLLGDYIDSTRLGKGRARVREVARELARLPRSAAVLGNHDWRGAGPAMGWALRDAGVRVLENEAVPAFVAADGPTPSSAVRGRLWLAGIACTRHRFPDARAALRDVPDDAAVLLAVHDPDFFTEVPDRPALTVAGHLHGGQVNVPTLRRAALPTSYGERYLAGHVVERGRHMYVSAGLGTAGLPLRLRRPPEVPVLRLTAAAPTAPAR
jgi:predicted MPP superfamily phosphohydrolase